MTRKHIGLLLIPLIFFASFYFNQPSRLWQNKTAEHSLTHDTIFGPCDTSHPLIQKLLNHEVMQRLKHVDQHGPSTYYGNLKTFSRYKHSVGVYALLQKFGRPFAEQVAGLLHDTSHTVFSHLADRFFGTGNQRAYQDNIHQWYLEKMGINDVLAPYNLTVSHILAEHPDFLPLKQKLPAMNADRIQYNLETGLSWNKLTQKQVEAITASLRLDGHTWYFINATHARQFADLSVFFTQHFWGAPENTVWHHWTVEAMKRAVELKLFSIDTLHFGYDHQVVAVMDASDDTIISTALHKCRNPDDYFTVVTKDQPHDLVDHPKFRGIDPLVELDDGSRVQLSTIDDEFAAEFSRAKDWCLSGVYIKLKKA